MKFNDRMKANKLKTFSDMYKDKKVKSSGKAVILKADRSVWTHHGDGTRTISTPSSPKPIALGSVDT